MFHITRLLFQVNHLYLESKERKVPGHDSVHFPLNVEQRNEISFTQKAVLIPFKILHMDLLLKFNCSYLFNFLRQNVRGFDMTSFVYIITWFLCRFGTRITGITSGRHTNGNTTIRPTLHTEFSLSLKKMLKDDILVNIFFQPKLSRFHLKTFL